MQVVLRYRFRLRPGRGASRELEFEWNGCRWLSNQAVAATRDRKPWLKDTDLTRLRAQHDWLRAGSVVAQQQTLRSFRSSKARRFKSAKRDLPSLNYTKSGFTIKDGRLCLPRKTVIPVVWSRALPSEPSSVRVYRDPLGHWYASFVVRREEKPLEPTNRAVGVDWGVKRIATTSEEGYDLVHAEHGKRAAARLTRYQRRMARRKPEPGQPASKGYRKAKRDAAKQYRKVARQRQDTARKWVRKVVRAFDGIAVEDFKPEFLSKGPMARKAADGTIAATKRELIEYAERMGRNVVLVAPAYTTMTCGRCAARTKSRIPLERRVFHCDSCGFVEDRDRNAARVVLATAGFNRAGVDVVRRPSPHFVGTTAD
jgi:putative transposase